MPYILISCKSRNVKSYESAYYEYIAKLDSFLDNRVK